MKKIIIAGSRKFHQYDVVETAVSDYLTQNKIDISDVEIVSGHADGIDDLGERFAKLHNCPIKIFPANWDKYGRAAGPIRNEQMAKYGDILIAFWDFRSKGTASMISLARKHNLQVHIVHI